MDAPTPDHPTPFDDSPIGLWIADLRSNEVRCNAACANLLALEGRQVNLARFLSMLKLGGLAELTRRWNDAMASAQGEFVAEHAVGSAAAERWVLTKAMVSARDREGLPLHVNGYCLDITERKAMEQTLMRGMQESEAVLNMAPTAVAILHGSLLVGCNRAMEELFAYPARQLVGTRAERLFINSAEWHLIFNAVSLLSEPGSTELGEIECRSGDGRSFWAQVSGRCMTNADDRIFTFTDISRPREMANALAAARDAAEAASKAKSEFLAMMSHEIRTPMNGVLGMLELLDRSRLDDDQRGALTTARESAMAMVRLIGDILDFSKIEARQIDMQMAPVSLADLTARAAALYETMAAAKGLVLRCNVARNFPAAHVADGLRISQILNNLLSNSIKFTERGTIRLMLGLEGRGKLHDHVVFRVIDTGIGIDPDKQRKLFQPFVQADSGTTRKYGGTGLGLAISLQLAKLMGGNIEMSSQPGRGTTVRVQLRLARAEAPATSALPAHSPPSRAPVTGRSTQAPPSPARESSRQADLPLSGPEPRRAEVAWLPTPASRARVLVIEDHPVNRMLLQRQVSLLGLRCDTAEDGQSGLERWRKGSYELVLCDIHMPHLDGFDLARTIRSEELGQPDRTPTVLIACTANTRPEDAEQCIAAGMNDCLFKPVTLQVMREKLTQWLPGHVIQEQQADC